MLNRLTNWTISLAGRKSAQYWLAFIAFIESSIFLIPADVLFIPMSIVKPQKAWRYAFIATVFSVLGGVLGWFIGYYAYETIAVPVLEFYNKLNDFETLRDNTSTNLILFLLITSGLSHLPPIKVVTILSGVVGINIWIFIILAILARGMRFYLLAWLLNKYGPIILNFVLKRLTFIFTTICVIGIMSYTAYKLSH